MSRPARLTLLVLIVAAGCHRADGGGERPTAVRDENALPGDEGWRLDDFFAGDPGFAIFARPMSVTAGARVDVQASHPVRTEVGWAVYRLGHYGGAGGRRLLEGSATIGPQPPPDIDPATGLVECRWPAALSFAVGTDWLSGVYVVKLSAADGSARLAPFIVRDDRRAGVALVMPTATDAAYNPWGGESLYLDTRFGFPSGHARAVSLDRPFALEGGGGYFLHSAMPTARYLEANGYDVTYLADHDLARVPSPLERVKAALVLAHDEYWSKAMRDNLEAARDAGKTLGFLGANIGFWQVRFEPAWDGTPDQRMIGYKEDARLDPVQGPENTGAFARPPIDRPENALLGIMTVAWHMVDFPWRVTDPGHWLYAGTGAVEGELWPGLVGVESDGVVDNGLTPPQLTRVARSPTLDGDEPTPVWHEASVYETPAGGAVFAAGSIRFAARLSGPHAQLGAQRLVRNLLGRAGVTATREEDTLGATTGFAAGDTTRAATRVTIVAGAAGAPGFADGPGATARFDAPFGIAVAPDGAVIVAEAGNRRVRRIGVAPPREVTTLAGSGAAGDDDGPAAAATFQGPLGVAVAPDGTVYVSDTFGSRVRRIAAGVVSTVAGPEGLRRPAGIAVGPDGRLYVADYADGAIKVVAPGGAISTLVGGLAFPTGVLVRGGDVVIVESGRRAILVRDAAGTLTRVAGTSDSGFADGDATTAQLGPVFGIAALGADLLVADPGSYRVRLVEPGPTRATTWVRTFAGADAGLILPTGLAVDPARGIVYVADTGNAVIRALAR